MTASITSAQASKADLAATLLRVTSGVWFIIHALIKVFVFTIPGTVGFFESLGLPGAMAYLVIAAELLGGTHAIGLHEPLEQTALLFGGHARAGIHDHELDPFRPERLDFQGDAALRGELDGIVAEIQKDLADTSDVAEIPGRHFRIDLNPEVKSFLQRHRLQQGLHIGQ